jgi:hypothetical protein
VKESVQELITLKKISLKVKGIKTLFEYMYYRITKAYSKREGNVGITAIISISLCQTLFIVVIIFSIMRLFLHRTETVQYTKLATTLVVGLNILIDIWNYSKYKNKFDEYEKRWGNENSSKRRLRGIFIVIVLFLPLIIAIFLGRIQL